MFAGWRTAPSFPDVGAKKPSPFRTTCHTAPSHVFDMAHPPLRDGAKLSRAKGCGGAAVQLGEAWSQWMTENELLRCRTLTRFLTRHILARLLASSRCQQPRMHLGGRNVATTPSHGGVVCQRVANLAVPLSGVGIAASTLSLCHPFVIPHRHCWLVGLVLQFDGFRLCTTLPL